MFARAHGQNSRLQHRRIDRQCANLLSRRGEDRVTECRDGGRQRWFSRAGWRVLGVEEMHFDRCCLRHPQQREGVEIRLHDAAVLNRDLLMQRLAEAIENGALREVESGSRINHLAADIAYCPHFVDLDVAVRRYRSFDDFGASLPNRLSSRLQGPPHGGEHRQAIVAAAVGTTNGAIVGKRSENAGGALPPAQYRGPMALAGLH